MGSLSSTEEPTQAPAAAAAPAEHPEKKRMTVMSKHLNAHFGEHGEHQKEWMAHFGVNAAGDIVNKNKHDRAVAGFVGAVDAEGNITDKAKFSKACEKIAGGAKKDAKKEKAASKGAESADKPEKVAAKAKAKAKEKKKDDDKDGVDGSKICVRNLPDNTTEDKIKEIFASFGTIKNIDIKTKDNGKSKGFGFVQFSSAAEGTKAIKEMNDKEVNGKKLAVSHAYPKEKAQDAAPAKGGKGKGGEKGDGKGSGKGPVKGQGKGVKGGKGWARIPGAQGSQLSAYAQQALHYGQYQAQMQELVAIQVQANLVAQYQIQQQLAYEQEMHAWYAQATSAALQKEAHADANKWYLGEIKRVTEKNGYGFIHCEELKGRWTDKKNPGGRDIYVASDLLPESCKQPGCKVKFKVSTNAKGHPQATACEAFQI